MGIMENPLGFDGAGKARNDLLGDFSRGEFGNAAVQNGRREVWVGGSEPLGFRVRISPTNCMRSGENVFESPSAMIRSRFAGMLPATGVIRSVSPSSPRNLSGLLTASSSPLSFSLISSATREACFPARNETGR